MLLLNMTGIVGIASFKGQWCSFGSVYKIVDIDVDKVLALVMEPIVLDQ